MATQAEVPVRIAPDAEARVEELGMRQQLDTMLEHTKQTVPGLRAIEVTRYDDPWEPGEPRIHIMAIKEGPGSAEDPTWDQWSHWVVRAFPGDVLRWFGFYVDYYDHAG